MEQILGSRTPSPVASEPDDASPEKGTDTQQHKSGAVARWGQLAAAVKVSF